MIDEIFEDHIQTIKRLRDGCGDTIEQLGINAAETLIAGNTIFLCGNGGSAADAQHLAAEIVGRFELDRKGCAAVALTVDTSALTAIANDYGFEQIFSRQIEALGHPGDMLIGISTSGNSLNVVVALQQAKKLGLFTAGFTGIHGGKIKGVVDLWIPVPSNVTARIQEAHILIGHIMCKFIDEKMTGVRIK